MSSDNSAATGREITLTDPNASLPFAPGTGIGFQDVNSFELLQRVAKVFSACSLVPDVYRGKVADCAIVVDMAQRMKCSPLMAFQNLNIINGKPGWNSQFLIATVNASGKFTPLEFEFFGAEGDDTYGCRAYAKRSGTQRILNGPRITVAMAKAEGWWGRKGSKWPTMTELMLTYRAAAFWVRIFAPEMAAGLLTEEEQHDIVPVRQLETAASQVQQNTRIVAPAPTPSAEQQEAADCPSSAEASCENADTAEPASPTPSPLDSPHSPSGEGTPSDDSMQAANNAAALQEAYDAGRDAAEAGATREIPKKWRYKIHEGKAAAWLEGYDYQINQDAGATV